jgi:CheY-like chemotaxis protein
LIPVRYDIPSLINDTAQLNRLRYESKPIVFNVQVDENTPLELFGDELRIKQVLNNILSNAFKYTDEGTIEFSVSSEPLVADGEAQDENVTIVFRVKDTGQGMTEEEIGRLFDEYTRFNANANRTTIGAGLGMSIAMRLVELMNGSITVESESGKGSLFTLRIPQKRAGSAVCGAELAGKLRNFRFQSMSIVRKTQFLREYMPYGSVLVVDDVESNVYVAKGMLMPYGLKIETAANGFEAVEKIKKGNVYDIVFMDHMMPKMDGIEATKIIRGMGYTNSIVALTANALIGREEMFLRNGFDGFISKPLDSRELNLVLNDFIRNRKPAEVVEAARQEQREKENRNPSATRDKAKTSELKSLVARDAENAIAVLERLYVKIDDLDDNEADLYITTVHGMKSVLANIGEKDLSAAALRLEQAGKRRDIALILNETRAFMDAIKSLIAKFKPTEENNNTEITGEDLTCLREKLQSIKTACAALDIGAANAALDDLKRKTWPARVKKALDEVSTHLLHSAFDEAAETAGNVV